MSQITLTQLCDLVNMSRRTVLPLLAGVPYEAGPNKSHIYQSDVALRTIYTGRAEVLTLQEARTKNELAAAKLRQIQIDTKLEHLVPAGLSRLALRTFGKYVCRRLEELRQKGLIDEAWIGECLGRFAPIVADLAVMRGLQFARGIAELEDIQALKELRFPEHGFPEQPSQDQLQP